MTKLITAEDLPRLIKDAVLRDLSDLISKKAQMNGLCLEYADGSTNYVYILYLIKNATGDLEEIFFVTNDIIMDYRKPIKSPNAQAFLLDL